MYLQQLNQLEKENFLELAYLLANIDKEFANEEKLQFLQYRYEMHLHEDDYNMKEKSIDVILEELSESEESIKKIITFELIGLALSDKNLRVQEIEMLKQVRTYFNISEEAFNKMQNKIEELQKLYFEVNELLSI
ncbi:MAG: hypothetical protein JXR36_13575 [Bacteroidales bacterium]|nr:hypothetical protein [Bacteroidales bacterium]